MDTKRTIAERIHTIVPELDQEQVVNLLEIPKNSDMGDLAFPAFSLAKIASSPSITMTSVISFFTRS